jgi:hypothetical protein
MKNVFKSNLNRDIEAKKRGALRKIQQEIANGN